MRNPASIIEERKTRHRPETGPNAVIEVEDLVTHYGERMILKGVSMSVLENEIMVIMGGSGSGKSTLLRHLMALEEKTSGTMRILGNRNSSTCVRNWAWRSSPVRCSVP